jgi:hypothetical protein
MAGDEVLINSSDIVSEMINDIVPALMERAGPLVTIFKAVGVVLIVYIAYLIYRGVIRLRDRKRLKIIEKKVFDIDAKLDKLVKKGDKPKEKKKKK